MQLVDLHSNAFDLVARLVASQHRQRVFGVGFGAKQQELRLILLSLARQTLGLADPVSGELFDLPSGAFAYSVDVWLICLTWLTIASTGSVQANRFVVGMPLSATILPASEASCATCSQVGPRRTSSRTSASR